MAYSAASATQLSPSSSLEGRRRRLWLMALLCSLALAVELMTLFYDLDRPEGPARMRTGPRIARMREAKREVRNKPAGTIIWDRPEPGQALFANDTIATMAGSQATLEFEDHSIIEIHPDSLVVLEAAPPPSSLGILGLAEAFRARAPIRARLIHGSISRAKAGASPLLLSFSDDPGAKPVKLEGTTDDSVFRVVKRGETIEVIVEAGMIHVDGAEVDRGSAVTLTGNPRKPADAAPAPLPAPRLREPKIEIIEPESRNEPPARDWVAAFLGIFVCDANAAEKARKPAKIKKGEVKVHFDWDPIAGARSYRVEIAQDQSFEHLVTSDITSKTTFDYQARSPEETTTLYFRVAGIDREGSRGEFSAIEKVELRPIPGMHPSPKPSPVEIRSLPVPSSTPGPVLTETLHAAETARAAPSPKPSPAPEPPPAPIAIAPVTIASPTPSIQARVAAAYAAVYQSRHFSSDPAPKNADGSGFLPTRISVSGTLTRPDFGLIDFRASVVFESISALNPGASAGSVSIPDIEAQAVYHRLFAPLAPYDSGFGLWYGTSENLSFESGALAASARPLIGPVFTIGSDLAKTSGGAWSFELPVTIASSFGIEPTVRLKLPFGHDPGPWIDYQGVYGALELQERLTGIERRFGAAAEVGYVF